MPPARWATPLRDFLFLTLPWVLIFKQAGILFDPPEQVSIPLLVLAGAMLGVPGIAQIAALLYGAGASGGDTPTSPSLPVGEASPPSSSSSSPGVEGAS